MVRRFKIKKTLRLKRRSEIRPQNLDFDLGVVDDREGGVLLFGSGADGSKHLGEIVFNFDWIDHFVSLAGILGDQ